MTALISGESLLMGSGDNSRATRQGSTLTGTSTAICAGRDAKLQVAQVAGTAGGVTVGAGNDIKLTTATELECSKTQRDSNRWKGESTAMEVGTQVVAQGDIVLNAGQDPSARAVQVSSTTDAMAGVAGRGQQDPGRRVGLRDGVGRQEH